MGDAANPSEPVYDKSVSREEYMLATELSGEKLRGDVEFEDYVQADLKGDESVSDLEVMLENLASKYKLKPEIWELMEKYAKVALDAELAVTREPDQAKKDLVRSRAEEKKFLLGRRILKLEKAGYGKGTNVDTGNLIHIRELLSLKK